MIIHPMALITTGEIVTYSVIGVAAFALLSFLIVNLLVGYFVYVNILKRGVHDDWGRHCSGPEKEMVFMYEQGMKWRETVTEHVTEVDIENDGYHLYGEYFDFGSDCCVIFLPGRMESLQYSYFFVQPYAKEGYNVLSIDPRSHGLSEGTYNCVGFEEYKDVIAWSKYIHETFGVQRILLHGICIGSAGGMLAATSEQCPDYIVGLIADGMFANFGESMKNHLIERNKPTKPTLTMINFWMKLFTHHDMTKGPIDYVPKMKKPLLMIHSKTDIYSVPELAVQLFEKCASEQKKLVWFDNSRHSMIRYNYPEKYDAEVISFAKEVFLND